MVMRVWARRYHDLGRLRTQAVCRLHAVLCELVPGGATQAAADQPGDRGSSTASSPIPLWRRRNSSSPVSLSPTYTASMRSAARPNAAPPARSPRLRTCITGVYGVGPIVAGTVLGYVRDIRRFPTRDRFASYNGTAPIEVSSGDRKIYRLSRRGNRQLNHAIHMAAVTQIRHRGSEGRAYYQRKIAEGMTATPRSARLKRKISDALYAADDRRRATARSARTREGTGERRCLQRGRLTPRKTGSSEKPLPGHRQL